MASSERYMIPEEWQGRVLRQHYSGSSAREIYIGLWPGGGKTAPVREDAFTRALRELVLTTENEVRRTTESAGLPFLRPSDEITPAVVRQAVTVPLVIETDLDAASELVVRQHMIVRDILMGEIEKCRDDDLDVEETRSDRARAIAALSAAVDGNAEKVFKASALRTQRTILHHNLVMALPGEQGGAGGATGSGAPPINSYRPNNSFRLVLAENAAPDKDGNAE